MLVKFDFNTPGSQVDRHVSLDANWKYNDVKLSLKFKSPVASIDVIGMLLNSSSLLRLFSTTSHVPTIRRFVRYNRPNE